MIIVFSWLQKRKKNALCRKICKRLISRVSFSSLVSFLFLTIIFYSNSPPPPFEGCHFGAETPIPTQKITILFHINRPFPSDLFPPRRCFSGTEFREKKENRKFLWGFTKLFFLRNNLHNPPSLPARFDGT